jgi:RNA polymerase sigma-70 factor, ECF subfamily
MVELQSETIESLGESLPFGQTEAHNTILEKIYSAHSSTLYKIALRKLGNPADAEDALQEGLMSAFRHINQFRGDAQIST